MKRGQILWVGASSPVEFHEPIEAGFSVSRVQNLLQMADSTEAHEVDGVLVSGMLPGMTRLGVLETIRTMLPSTSVIFADKNLTAGEAAILVRNGAYHCANLQDTGEHLRQILEDACEESCRRKRIQAHRSSNALERMLIGQSRPMQDVLNTIGIVGRRRCTVLISGETGTGKEMAARALHLASSRSHLPMVAVNCSALPENLLEAELFGHVKGAFTGAVSNRLGRFEQANKSTLFLDEIGELPVALQAKLLRALQEREIQRLGSSETVRVDVRVIAATNSNLEEQMRRGQFREDLFYRLNVVPLRMPPLRERRGDIPLLLDHFVAKICTIEGIPPKRVAPEARQRLSALPWPGNVRQLENLVEMAIALSDERETLYSSDFGLPAPPLTTSSCMSAPALATDLSEPIQFDTVVNQFEHSILNMALSKTGGNKTAAAELLGMKRTTLIMKLRSMQGCSGLAQMA